MTKSTQLPPTSFGVVYPGGDVIAVIDDGTQAGRAVEAVRQDGIADTDIVLLSGPEAIAAIHAA